MLHNVFKKSYALEHLQFVIIFVIITYSFIFPKIIKISINLSYFEYLKESYLHYIKGLYFFIDQKKRERRERKIYFTLKKFFLRRNVNLKQFLM